MERKWYPRKHTVVSRNKNHIESTLIDGPGNFMPVDEAGCFAFTFSSWITPLIWKIFHKGLSKLDIYHCSPFDNSSLNGASLSSLWDQEVKTKGLENSSLRHVLFCFIRTRFLLSCFMYIICVSFGFLGPTIFMRLFLQYVQSPELEHFVGIKWMSGLIFCELMRVISMSLMWAICTRTAVRSNTGMLALFYSKMMRVRPAVRVSLGELMNSFANDSQKVFMMVYNSSLVIGGPLVIIGAFIYTWWILGVISLIGAVIFMFCYMLQILISYLNIHYRKRAVAVTDQRVSLITELWIYIRFVKLYVWEKPLLELVKDARLRERTLLQKCQFLHVLSFSLARMSSLFATIITLLVYISFGYDISAAQAFTLVMVYSIAGHGMRTMPLCFQDIVNGSVALKRLEIIMKLEEQMSYITLPASSNVTVCISDATFVWDHVSSFYSSNTEKEANLSLIENEGGDSRDFEAVPEASLNKCCIQPSLVNISLAVENGKLVGVCGMVGSGKSALLTAILGQMRLLMGHISVRGTFAYVSQQPWILNESVYGNILFGHSFNQKRYYEALYCCNLLQDISSFSAGDQTQIGERGVTLSGGQKHRISLARALYADKDIYLLDDPLSSVDSHVGSHIFQNCIQGALKEKTVFLVTHQLEYLEKCDIIIVMKNGQILEQGSHYALIENQAEYASLFGFLRKQKTSEIQHKKIKLDNLEGEFSVIDTCTYSKSVKNAIPVLEETDGCLMNDEKMATGNILWSTYRGYIQAAGGFIICAAVLFCFFIQGLAGIFSNWWLSYWLSQGNTVNSSLTLTNHSEPLDNSYFQVIYGVSVGVMGVSTIITGFLFTKLSLQASTTLHDCILIRMLHCPLHFFDTRPSGQLVNIFTRDTDEIDTHLPSAVASLLQHGMAIICSLLMMSLVFPWLLLVMILIGSGFVFLQKIFRVVMRDLKRLENVSRNSIYSHISRTLEGLSVIQAFRKQEEFMNRFHLVVDENASLIYLYHISMRWLGSRLDILCIVITLATSLFTVFLKGHVDSSLSALALTISLQLSGMYQYFVRLGCDVESRFTSVERIQTYIQSCVSEIQSTSEEIQLSPDWPKQGCISFRNVSMRYRPGLDLSLKKITFDINPQEKIGIVGRTGSGKSSIGTVLFRLFELAAGAIYIDGVDISKLQVEDVRSRLSIIPQDPVLFHGTVKHNLDPFGKKSDEELWDSLQRSHMKEKIVSIGGLEAFIEEGGKFFSVGEKQLFCISRALLKHSKILLLDEATAAIDLETDFLVHSTIQDIFSGCTVIIIAHRFNTVINCDRVMVISDGKIVEFEKPSILLNNPKSLFAKLVAAEMVSTKPQK